MGWSWLAQLVLFLDDDIMASEMEQGARNLVDHGPFRSETRGRVVHRMAHLDWRD